MRITFLISAVLLLVACSPKLAAPTQADVERVSAKHPDYTLASLQEGRSLYQTHCGTCHGLKKPSAFAEADWQKIVPAMVKKANKKAGKESISAAQQALILQYVSAMTKH